MRWRLLALSLVLAACARPDYNAACKGYGFKPGTEAYANCLMQYDLARMNAPAPVFTPPPPVYTPPKLCVPMNGLIMC